MAVMTPDKAASEVAENLSAAAGKIRLHDLTVGGLGLAALVLGYVATVITLDKYLELDATLRQLMWVGFVLGLAMLARRWLWVPLRGVINPLYAAKKVEETVDDAKNSVVNYVDLKDTTMPESVRHAVALKASKHLANADLNKATESRALIVAGSAVAGLVVVLAVLFLTFKPTVFASLVGRALNPFSSNSIAARTTLSILEPAGGDATIVAGTPFTVRVAVEGREPDVNAADKVRVLLRHTQTTTSYEEVPLEPIGNREWSVRVPPHLVQSGFWYRVAGGDAETAEHRVTVKPRPVIKTVEVGYEYPAYLNMKPETSRDPHIEAYRGTVVTIRATANRPLKDARMIVSDSQPVLGTVAGDTLGVKFTLMENGTYRLIFTSIDNEVNSDASPHLLRVISDAAPTVTFKPSQSENSEVPSNGMLTIDADAADDFGIDHMTLKMRVGSKELTSKPFRGGKSFKRETDGTWPKSVDYKDSVKVESLKLNEGDVLEYWLEATDNCTVPKPNVGTSKVYKARIVAKQTETEDLAKKNTLRAEDETDHARKQDTKNNTESRPKQEGPQGKKQESAPQAADPTGNPDAKNQSGIDPPAPNPNKTENKQPEPKNGSETSKDKTEPKSDGSNSNDKNESKNGGQNANESKDPNKGGDGSKDNTEPKNGNESPKGSNEPQKGGESPADKDLKQKADAVQKEIDKQERQEGAAKNNDTPGEEPKNAEKKDGDKGNAESKPEPKDGHDSSGGKSEGTKPQPEPKEGDGRGSEPKESPPKKEGNGKTPEQGAGNPKGEGADKAPKADPKPDTVKQPNTGKGGAADESGDGKNAAPPKTSESKPSNAAGKLGSESKGDGSQSADAKPSPGQPGAGMDKPGQPKRQDWDQAQRDLSHENPGKQEAARQDMEKNLGRDQAKEAENLFRDLKSNDPQKRKEAEDKLDQLKKKHEQEMAQKDKDNDELAKKKKDQPQSGGGGGDAKQDVANAEKNLNSGDKAKQDGAKQALNDAMKNQAKKDADQLSKDLQSKDDATRAAAEKKLEDLKKQMGDNGKAVDDMKKGLQSDDPKQQQAGKQGLKDAMQDQAKKDAGKMSEDLQSKDQQTKDGAQKKLDDLKDSMAKDAPPKPADVDKAAKQPGTKESKDTMDKAAGEQAKADAQKLAKDLDSKDPATKAAAEKKIEDMAKAAEEAMKKGGGKEDKDVADAAKQMKDDKTEAATERLQEAMQKQAQKRMEQMMKDLNGTDPAKKEQAQKDLEAIKKALDEMAKGDSNRNPKSGPGGNTNDTTSKPLAESELDKRTATLQLEKFKKERNNTEMQKKLGMTKEDYERFLKGMEEMANRPEPARAEAKAPEAKPVPTINTGTAGAVTQRNGVAAGSPEANGTATAPAGYSEAQKKFLDAARRAQER